MMCYRRWGEDGYELRDVDTNRIVCGPTWSLGEVSRFSRDNKITIVDRPESAVHEESDPTREGEVAKS